MNSRSISIYFVIICCFFLVSCKSPLEDKLRELDKAIENRNIAEDSLARRADRLRDSLASYTDTEKCWNCCKALYRLYSTCQADSAIVYLDKMEQLCGDDAHKTFEVRYNRAMTFSSRRDYHSAQENLDEVDLRELDETDYAKFYKAQLYIYGMMCVDEMIPQSKKDELHRIRNEMRLTYISCPGIEPMEKIRRNAMQRYQNGHAAETIPILEDLLQRTEDPQDKLDVAYSIAEAYLYAGNRTMREWWMAQNAITALNCGNKTTLSLYELCNMLFEDKRLSRASNYCKLAVENALSSGFASYILNSAYSQLTIATAVVTAEKNVTRWAIIIILILASLVLVSLALLRKLYKQKGLILHINNQLEDAGRVKEGYLYKYMGMAVKYLDSVEGLRRSVRKAMKEGNTEAINTLLRDPRYNREEYTHFYQEFDKTFLGIYPDFVSKVNELLPPEEQFSLRKGGALPTSLRILAAIKLGFTDSGSIAEFLSCAPSSVYTYRSRIKRVALCPADKFEDKLKEI